jgi:hypothetical protein
MNRNTQLSLALTVVAALLGAAVGLYLGFRLGEASSDQVGHVVIGAYLGLLTGPGLSVWGLLAVAKQGRAGRTALYLTLAWVPGATAALYVVNWLGAPQNLPGVLALLVVTSFVARLWANSSAHLAHHRGA